MADDSRTYQQLAGPHDFYMLYHAPTAAVQSLRSFCWKNGSHETLSTKNWCQGMCCPLVFNAIYCKLSHAHCCMYLWIETMIQLSLSLTIFQLCFLMVKTCENPCLFVNFWNVVTTISYSPNCWCLFILLVNFWVFLVNSHFLLVKSEFWSVVMAHGFLKETISQIRMVNHILYIYICIYIFFPHLPGEGC